MADELFSKRLPLTLKSQDKEDRKTQIQVTVELHTNTAPTHRKELVIRLTDEKDLFFLYFLRLGEEDFQSLKVQQGLLVDFGSFPQKFIDLLELCIQEEHKDVPKFVLNLVSNGTSPASTANLDVIETNPFKHLVHLSLKFLPGSDTDIKKYLADCLKHLKDQKSMLLTRLEHTEGELSQQLKQTREALSARTHELDNLKTEWSSKASDLSSRYSQDINGEKEKALLSQQAVQQRHEKERREQEQSYMKSIKQMETRIFDLESANKDLTDRKYKSESTIRELKGKLSTSDEENLRMKQELQSLRKNNANLDSDYHDQEKNLNQSKTRIAVLEQEVKDKEEVMTKTTDLFSTEKDQKRKIEDDLERKRRQGIKLESSLKKMADELRKANDIIKKLQTEVKNHHSKLTMRAQVTSEQEKLLIEKNKEMEEMRKEIQELKMDLKGKHDENAKLNEIVDASKRKLEESKELLKTNENVINWLNKQINDNHLHGGAGSRPAHGTFEMPNAQPAASTAFRPSSGTLHNFTASYSSRGSGSHPLAGGAMSHNSSGQSVTSVNSNASAPRQPHVHYNPGQAAQGKNASTLPQPVAKSSPIGTIPEERANGNLQASPPHLAQSRSSSSGLDNKYLSQSQEAPLRSGGPSLRHPTPSPNLRHPTPSPISFLPPHGAPPSAVVHNTRLSRDAILPRGTGRAPVQPPLASAYFPGPAKVS